MLHYGDIVYADLNPSLGHEQNKRRPLLVVGNDRFNRNCNLTFVTPITHTDNGYPLHVDIGAIPCDDGESLNGFAAVEQTKSLDLRARGARKVGTAPDTVMAKVSRLLLACLLRDDQSVISSMYLE